MPVPGTNIRPARRRVGGRIPGCRSVDGYRSPMNTTGDPSDRPLNDPTENPQDDPQTRPAPDPDDEPLSSIRGDGD